MRGAAVGGVVIDPKPQIPQYSHTHAIFIPKGVGGMR